MELLQSIDDQLNQCRDDATIHSSNVCKRDSPQQRKEKVIELNSLTCFEKNSSSTFTNNSDPIQDFSKLVCRTPQSTFPSLFGSVPIPYRCTPSMETRAHEFKKGRNVCRAGVESYEYVPVNNWSRKVQFTPAVIFFPKTQEDIIAIVKDAHANEKRITIIGKGHSWNPFMKGSDYLISTFDLHKIIDIDPIQKLVTLESGATIDEVDRALASYQLIVPCNIVGAPNVTYGGIMAVGSHGTGRTCSTMSDLMEKVEIIKADGTVEVFSEATHGKDLMDVVRLNLGLLGVMHKITFRVEAASNIEVRDQNIPVKELFQYLPSILANNESVEVLWFPRSDNVTVKIENKTNKPVTPISETDMKKRENSMEMFDKYVSKLLSYSPNYACSLMSYYSPDIFPTRTYVTDANTAMHYVKGADRFPIVQTEITLPFNEPNDLQNIRKAWETMVNKVYEEKDKDQCTLNLLIHMRFTAGSDAYLSPAYGHKGTAWVDFASYYSTPDNDWRQSVETLSKFLLAMPGAKAHWAKDIINIKDFDAEKIYGNRNIEWVRKVVYELDPTGMFSNDFMRKRLKLNYKK